MTRKALPALPPGYHSAGTMDVTRDSRMLFVLNAAGLVLFFVFSLAFGACLFYIRPLEAGSVLVITVDGIASGLKYLGGFLLVNVFMLVIHEGAHGMFFAIFTGRMPQFGFRWYLAYAAAPGWYIPRGQYLITALAPLALVSGLGVFALSVLPAGWLLAVLSLIVLNASGSVGDIWVAVWLLRQPAGCLAQDEGERVTLYIPGECGN